MLKNLESAISNKGLAKNAIAASLGVTEKTLYNKLQGETTFSVVEAIRLQESLFPEYELKYLFASDNDSNQAS